MFLKKKIDLVWIKWIERSSKIVSSFLAPFTLLFYILFRLRYPITFSSPMASTRRIGVGPTTSTTMVTTSVPVDRMLKSRYSDQSLENSKRGRTASYKGNGTSLIESSKQQSGTPVETSTPIINISSFRPTTTDTPSDPALADELDYITITPSQPSTSNVSPNLRPDKASRILGIRHRKSMEPIPASTRNSIVSTRSLRETSSVAPSHVPTSPLTSLYVVSGLPKSPHTWTLADPDSVLGLHHSESAVNRWWRPEVLGSTVSPGAGGGKKKKRGKNEEVMKGAGALSKQEVGKMLSKALKVSYCFWFPLTCTFIEHFFLLSL